MSLTFQMDISFRGSKYLLIYSLKKESCRNFREILLLNQPEFPSHPLQMPIAWVRTQEGSVKSVDKELLERWKG